MYHGRLLSKIEKLTDLIRVLQYSVAGSTMSVQMYKIRTCT